MRTPDDLAPTISKRYRSVWKGALLDGSHGPYSFFLDPPTAATVASRPTEVAAWLTRWRNWVTQHPSVSLRNATVRTTFGQQPIVTHLEMADTTGLAAVDAETAHHWSIAKHRQEQLASVGVGAEVKPQLSRIIALADADFATLLSAIAWFKTFPRSGLTARSVPVPGMHTKWLAANRALVTTCLNLNPIPDPADDENQQPELDRLGLRAAPTGIGIVLADPALRATTGGLRDITAPIDEIATLAITPPAALIVENKDPAVAWPDTPGLAIVHSLGNDLEALTRLPWLPRHNCWYWGDLDRHGFTLLSRARQLIPGLRSLMMRSTDVDTFQHLGIVENLTRYDPPMSTLTNDETQALAQLRTPEGHLRIEQERLPLADAQDRLNTDLR